ncbi:MAG: transcription-repair coupling factor, partial [Candidatus Sumerlaeota bacterium]|nr:transcription-repair coupling factor [Candidatus Sumerlaeota bacterium]
NIATRQAEEYAVHIVCDNDGQVDRLDEVLRERGLAAIPLRDAPALEAYRPRDVIEGFSDILLVVGTLHSGFIFPEIELAILTDREMFGRYKRRRVYRTAAKGRPIAAPSEIHRGDFVVHVEHGIGEFKGIRRQTIEGAATELLEIAYRDGATLLVPIEKIHLVQKYSSVDGSKPVLDRLGGKQWSARRSKIREIIEQMAEELLDLYARRSVARGHAYGGDTVWQGEFEASFLYQETPDQLEAIEQVKRDLMEEKPMDRLLCGDVGYGKTEIAIRAAFKVAQEKRQVAILAPTTILAQQHFNTFRERFADYPIRVDMLSRFRTPGEQNDILRMVAAGEIDVIVGTHRLLSKDVRFLDLGLLVIDEEQRFGVKQKERIKELRTSVDILTMTATPIPRTLHMALSGLRDMSLIDTPPPDRRPIRTKLIHFNQDQIEEAILRELNRGGQVFFVHNRVHNIQQVAQRVREIVPEAKIAIGHGQMNEHELEQVMVNFVDGQSDILVSTTIIENGLDIPNVNTIIINRADAFGLGQLYQLRGRVGRSQRQAYAYLVVPQGQPITETAVQRLSAIQEFTELGSGFQVAMRDLEIRGAGDLLGPRQHGAIQTVGFELYCQMLEEAVNRLRGRRVEEVWPVEILWKARAFLPSDYMPVEAHRIAVYKRLAQARSRADIDEIEGELRDRYGAEPPEAKSLCRLAALRVATRPAEITKVVQTEYGFKAWSDAKPSELAADFEALRAKDSPIRGLRVEGDGGVHVALRGSPEQRLQDAVAILEKLADALQPAAAAS